MERADGDAEAGFGSGVGGVAVETCLVEISVLSPLTEREGVGTVNVCGRNDAEVGPSAGGVLSLEENRFARQRIIVSLGF